jgi:hypothetical protein
MCKAGLEPVEDDGYFNLKGRRWKGLTKRLDAGKSLLLHCSCLSGDLEVRDRAAHIPVLWKE